MCFFSWRAQDTGRSISNRYSNRSTFPITMIDNKGNRYFEPNYEGYGVFGGKDYYILLAEMNNIPRDINESDADYRKKGLEVELSKKPTTLFPNLVEVPDHWNYTFNEPEWCEYQGFFYEVDMNDLYEDIENEFNEDDGYDLNEDTEYDGNDGYDYDD